MSAVFYILFIYKIATIFNMEQINHTIKNDHHIHLKQML